MNISQVFELYGGICENNLEFENFLNLVNNGSNRNQSKSLELQSSFKHLMDSRMLS